jgi:hypothetical protein
MTTITVPRPNVTSDEVTAALQTGLPNTKVQPGMRASRIPWRAPTPAEPDAIVVGSRMFWAQVRIARVADRTEIRVNAGGVSLGGWLIDTFSYVRRVSRVLRAAPNLNAGA